MKHKSVIVFLVIVLMFLQVGCQTKLVKPVEKEIVYPKWEYQELSIYCLWDDNLPCFAFGYDKDKFPDRVSILNNYGKQGWEVITSVAEGCCNVFYLLKRPLLK